MAVAIFYWRVSTENMRVRPLLSFVSFSALLLATSSAQADTNGWQGFYAGVSAGSREQKSQWHQDGKYTDPFSLASFNNGPQVKNESKNSDAYVGLYGGYNWLIGERVVAGLELSGGYANNQSEKNHIDFANFFGTTKTNTYVNVRSDWDAKLRGRLGFLVTPGTLLYGTGGLAATRMKASTLCPSDGIVCAPNGPNHKQSESETLLGWTAGFGVETTLTDSLVARAEYQYTDYKQASFWATDAEVGQQFGVHNKVDLSSQTVTVGLAYRF